MALKYGTNFLASDIARGLEKNEKQKEGTRTWAQLFGGASLGFGAQSDAITSAYSSAMREAYTANFNQRNSMMSSGLSQGYVDQVVGLSRQELADTYQNYVRNYSKEISAAASAYGSEVSAIQGDLTTRSENFSKLFSSAYDYLSKELSGSTMLDKTDLSDPIYALDKKGKPTGEIEGYNYKSLDYLTERGLDDYYNHDTEGNITGLKSFEELSKILFDEDGNITEEGQRFFDHMYNANPRGYMKEDETATRSFDEWLSEADPKLREWMLSGDEFNYTFAGTNLGSAKTMLGMESMDFKEDVPDTTMLSDEWKDYEYDFNSMFDEAQKGYDLAMSEIDTLIGLMTADAAAGSPSAGNYGPSMEKSFAKIQTTWNEYTNKLQTSINKFDTYLLNEFGTNLYNKFKEKNKSLYNKYESLLKELRNGNVMTSKDKAKEIGELYKKILEEASKYKISYRASKKNKSGF